MTKPIHTHFISRLGFFAFGLCALMGGALFNAYRLERIRNYHTGTFFFEQGWQFLQRWFHLLPGEQTFFTAWENSLLYNFTAHMPWLLEGSLWGVMAWLGLSCHASWQNCCLFRQAYQRIGSCFLPLLFYLPLLFLEWGPEKSTSYFFALLPISTTIILLAVAVNRIKAACLPVGRKPAPVTQPGLLPLMLVLIMAAWMASQWHAVAWLRHQHFYSHAYDLGLMSHVLNRFITGDGLTSSLIISGEHFLGHHFSPILYLLSPFYFFSPIPSTLLLIQTLSVAFAAVWLYLLGRDWLQSSLLGISAALIYLFFPGLSEGLYSDFHCIALAPFLFFWLAYEILGKNSRRYWVPLILLLMVQEDLFLYSLALSLFLLLFKSYRTQGILVASTSLVYGFLVLLWLQPGFRPVSDNGFGFIHRYNNLLPDAVPGANLGIHHLLLAILTQPGEVLKILFRPENLDTFGHFWNGVWFVPLWSPASWILLLPVLENSLSAEPMIHTWQGHYAFGPVGVSMLAVLGTFYSFMLLHQSASYLGKYLPGRSQTWLVPFSFLLVVSGHLWSLQHSSLPTSALLPHLQYQQPLVPPGAGEQLLVEIPLGSSVAAQSHLIPRLVHQKELYLLPPGQPHLKPGTEHEGPHGFENLEPDGPLPEYLVLDPEAPSGDLWHNLWYFDPPKIIAWIDFLIESGQYQVISNRDPLLILKRIPQP